jgi:ubiquinone/menaquinone biosynthesis C-methylase UbiE
MSTRFGRGFHARIGQPVDSSAYDRWTGRWSRPFVPSVLAAAKVRPGCRVLDVSTGTGEAAMGIRNAIGGSDPVFGADVSISMLEAARQRLSDPSFCPVAPC